MAENVTREKETLSYPMDGEENFLSDSHNFHLCHPAMWT